MRDMIDRGKPSVEDRSPVRRATRGIQQFIQSRGWVEGQRLPAEEALAQQFNVSRSTLRKALDELSQQGHVRREPHRGCVVATHGESDSTLVSRAVAVINDLHPPSDSSPAERSSAGIKQGMLDAANHLRRTALLMSLDSITSATTRQLIDARPQGLVMLCWRVCSPEARQFAALFHKAKIPVVAFGMDDVPEAVAGYDRVSSDHESGTRKLLELLARQGRKRVLRLWTPPSTVHWIAAHNLAYETSAPALGLKSLPPVYVPGIPEQQDGDLQAFNARTRHFAGYLAEHLSPARRVDAVMVATDSEVYNVAAACRLLGCRPGEDILITGYDNYWSMAVERKFEPAIPFATVDKRNSTIGAELIRLLDERIAHRSKRAPQFCRVEQDAIESHIYQAHGVRGRGP